MPVLDYLLGAHSKSLWVGQWADLRRLPRPPKSLRERADTARELFECDLLFVHRDAEGIGHVARAAEITLALAGCRYAFVPVVPERMQEAWFLFNEDAIRTAAGNPKGTAKLVLPGPRIVERERDPKGVLTKALRDASGLHGRHLDRFDARAAQYRLADLLDDYKPLRALASFALLERAIQRALAARGCSK